MKSYVLYSIVPIENGALEGRVGVMNSDGVDLARIDYYQGILPALEKLADSKDIRNIRRGKFTTENAVLQCTNYNDTINSLRVYSVGESNLIVFCQYRENISRGVYLHSSK